jgi:hypothetical protein
VTLPSREDLARELVQKSGECGFIKDQFVCTRPKDHEGQHRGHPVEKVIPF